MQQNQDVQYNKIKIQKTIFFEKSIIFLMLFLTFILLNLFVFNLPIFAIGLWTEVEFNLSFSTIVFSLLGICILILFFLNKEISIGKTSKTLLLMSIVSCISLFSKTLPIINFLGLPMYGEGILLFCGLSILSINFDILNQTSAKKINFLIFLSVIFATLFIFYNHQYFLNKNPDLAPYSFNAFLAPYALALFIIVKDLQNKCLKLIVTLLALFSLYVSGCKSLYVILCFSSIWFLTKNSKYKKLIVRLICLSIIFSSIIIGLALVYYNLFYNQYFLETDQLLPTFTSRGMKSFNYLLSIMHNPDILVHGNGFGTFIEELKKNTTQLPIHLYENGIRKVSWDGMNMFIFSCENQALEMLFSAGILGLISYLHLSLKPIKNSNFNYYQFLFLLSFCAFSSMWFITILSWPFFIFGFSYLFKEKLTIVKNKLFAIILIVLIFANGYGAFLRWQYSNIINASNDSIFNNLISRPNLPDIDKMKEPYFNEIYFPYYLASIFSQQDSLKSKNNIDFIQHCLNAYNPNNSSIIADLSVNAFFNELLKEKEINIIDFITWKNAVNNIVKKIPKRIDAIWPYIKYNIDHNDLKESEKIINSINDIHGIKLLYQSWIYKKQNNIEMAKKLYEQSVDMQSDKWIPIANNF